MTRPSEAAMAFARSLQDDGYLSSGDEQEVFDVAQAFDSHTAGLVEALGDMKDEINRVLRDDWGEALSLQGDVETELVERAERLLTHHRPSREESP